MDRFTYNVNGRNITMSPNRALYYMERGDSVALVDKTQARAEKMARAKSEGAYERTTDLAGEVTIR